jgi:trimethylamine:corrinoid methyltransferase-like protein
MEKIAMQLLSKEEQDRIHDASLEILENAGMVIMDAESLQLLAEAGAQVDFANRQVRFPAEVIQYALEKAPSEVKLYGRDTSNVIHLRQGNVYYSTSGYAVQIYDPASGQRREITQEDLAWITRLADGLDQVDIYALLGTPADAPPETNDRYQLAIALTNTTKHIWNTAYGKEGVEDSLRMAAAVRGSREALRQYPLFTLDLTILSPLQLDERQASTMVAGARQGIPIGASPGPIGGATGPVTLAGTLTQANAEFLGALTLCQAAQPGIPVIYTQWTRSLDMASGSVAMGGPEFSLLRVATAEMARYYHLPSRGGGLMADAKAVDAQMGMEKLLNCLMASLAGLNVVAGVGQTDFINTVRPDQMFIDNEMISLVKRMCQGIKVDEETLAVDVIQQVGPAGNYLAADHTVSHFRKELWFPKLFDRKVWSVWEEGGSLEIADRAGRRVLADKHVVPPLDETIVREIWDVVKASDRIYAHG